MDKTSEKIVQYREKIDVLDRLMMKLLKERFKLVTKIGRLKVRAGLPVYQKARWASMLEEHLRRGKKLNLNADLVKALMKLIHTESMRIQRSHRKKVKK